MLIYKTKMGETDIQEAAPEQEMKKEVEETKQEETPADTKEPWTKEILTEGDGESPKAGQQVEVHYTGT